MTGMIPIPTDRPLTAGDVPLLLEGDQLKIDTGGRIHTFDHAKQGGGVIATDKGYYAPYRFTFVSRPAVTRPAEDDAGVGERVGPWRIWFDPPPIGTRNCDWHYQHEDTDLDCPSWMNGSCASREACIAEIIEGYEDRK